MKSTISALLDGELESHEAEAAIDALKAGGEARETWRAYHLIGDSMRDTHWLSGDFAARVAARIAEEPTVMAPRSPARKRHVPAWAFAAAASLAVAFVGGSAFVMLQPESETALPVASVPADAAGGAEPAREIAQVPPPEEANDYLLAHQSYSPRNSLQGMAPYVRTVSTETNGSGR